MWKKIAAIFLIVVLAFAYYQDRQDAKALQHYYGKLAPTAVEFVDLTAQTAIAIDAKGNKLLYVGVAQAMGYGGPVIVGVIADLEGKLQEPVLLESRETPNYINDITSEGFFRQFTDKVVTEPLAFKQDVQGVSGATLSTRAIATVVEQVGHAIAASQFGYSPAGDKAKIGLGLEEIAVALLFAVAFICSLRLPLRRLRPVMLGLSVIIMGFWLNRSLAMSQISGGFLGYFPGVDSNLLWYIVLAGVLLPPLLVGKNLYCTWVCPFCGLQEGIHVITRQNHGFGDNGIFFQRVKDIILFGVLFAAFILKNPNLSSFEPFGTIFGLNGSALAWAFVGLVLIASAFYRRFWCRTLCPVGAFLDAFTKVRNSGVGWLKKPKEQPKAVKAPNESKRLNPETLSIEQNNPEPEKNAPGLWPNLAMVLYLLIMACILILTISKYMNMIISG